LVTTGGFGDVVHRRGMETPGGEELAGHVKKLVSSTKELGDAWRN